VQTLFDSPEPARDAAAGRAVARLRKKKPLTQEELAAAFRPRGFPWTQQVVARIEKGKRSLRLAEALELAAFFDVTVETLVSDTFEVMIGILHDRQVEAEFQARNRAEAARQYARQIERLQRLARAAVGETVSLGPKPQKEVLETFRALPWPEIAAILSSLGVPETDLDELAIRYGDARKKPHGDPVLIDEILLALQRALPTLEPRPE